jgi:hypothetical protein
MKMTAAGSPETGYPSARLHGFTHKITVILIMTVLTAKKLIIGDI